MARIYTVRFGIVGVAAVQDLLGVYAGATMAFEVHQVTIGQGTSSTVANLPISLRRLTATVTNGSGGSAATPAKTVFGDPAATVTARVNDTVQATSSGSNIAMVSDYYNVINGWLWLPAPEDRPVITINQAFIVSLDGAPGSSQNTSGTVTIAELL